MLRSLIVSVPAALTLSLTFSLGCDPVGPSPDDALDPIEDIADDGEDAGHSHPGDPGDDDVNNDDDGAGEPGEPPQQEKPETHNPAVPCDAEATERPCTTEGGAEGEAQCIVVDGEEAWTECLEVQPCWPGDGYDYGCMGGFCAWDGEALYWHEWSEPDCATPLVVNFERAPLSFKAASAAEFDISGVGECTSTDWPTMPWLALDRDHNGVIENGAELFGSGTVLGSGGRARDGFSALAELDLNRDGMITAHDPAFAELVLWADDNDDRRGDLSELTPVADVELIAIHLDTWVSGECDARGNCGGEVSTFEFRSATGEPRVGEIVDVYLPCQ